MTETTEQRMAKIITKEHPTHADAIDVLLANAERTKTRLHNLEIAVEHLTRRLTIVEYKPEPGIQVAIPREALGS